MKGKLMPTWYKWDYVCSGCDAHIEITALVDGHSIKTEMCMKCLSSLTLVSVEDVTIPNVTQKKEEEMITETPAQTMTVDWIENDVVTTKIYTESEVRVMVWQNKSLTNKQNEWYRKESQLRTLLEEVYANSDEQDTLSEIARIFDVSLTKEIEVTAYIQVQMTVEVDMADGDYGFVRDNLTIDSYDSAVSVNNYDVERVEEN